MARKSTVREATADDIGVLQEIAGFEIQRVDVVGRKIRGIRRRRLAYWFGLLFGFFEDLHGLLDIAPGLLVGREEEALAVRRAPGVDAVPASGGELEAVGTFGEGHL